MSTWPEDELQKIAASDDLHISPFREDGETYGTPTWIWSVVAFATMLAVALAASGPAFAQAESTPPSMTESSGAESASFDAAIERAEMLEPLHTLMVAQGGDIVVDEGFRGYSTDQPVNIKSASKSIVSALVGIAIAKGILESTEQKIAPLLRDKLPANPDPRIEDITIGHLLSMQAGLGRTSGSNYGAWVASNDWVASALAQPFVADPGGPMLYSTGSTHLLSAILTRESGRSTLALAREWLGEPAGVEITDWVQGPQGIYLGGNQMAMTPASLLAFGELYRNGGRTPAGEQILSPEWIEQSWTPRTRSPYSGEKYGYGWFISELAGYPTYYGWGYGGQMIYVIPELELTIAITSNPEQPSGRTGHQDNLRELIEETIIPAAVSRTAGH